MKLQYQIFEIYRNQYRSGHYHDHVGWKLWIGDEKLLKETNEKFGTMFLIDRFYFISDEIAQNIRSWYCSRNDLIGIFGDEEVGKNNNKQKITLI